MVNDPRTQAIGIINALDTAGLLRAQTPASTSVSEIIGALVTAGMLRNSASSTPPPPATRKVGDVVRLDSIRGVGKYVNPTSGEKYVRLAYSPTQDKTELYYLDFPPNDEKWLVEFEKIITAPKPLQVMAYVELTVVGPDIYHGKVVSLAVESWWNP